MELATLTLWYTRWYRRINGCRLIDYRFEYNTVLQVSRNRCLSSYCFKFFGHWRPVMLSKHWWNLVQKAGGQRAFLTCHHESLLYYRRAAPSAFSNRAVICLSISCCFDPIFSFICIYHTCHWTCLLPLLLLMSVRCS